MNHLIRLVISWITILFLENRSMLTLVLEWIDKVIWVTIKDRNRSWNKVSLCGFRLPERALDFFIQTEFCYVNLFVIPQRFAVVRYLSALPEFVLFDSQFHTKNIICVTYDDQNDIKKLFTQIGLLSSTWIVKLLTTDSIRFAHTLLVPNCKELKI